MNWSSLPFATETELGDPAAEVLANVEGVISRVSVPDLARAMNRPLVSFYDVVGVHTWQKPAFCTVLEVWLLGGGAGGGSGSTAAVDLRGGGGGGPGAVLKFVMPADLIGSEMEVVVGDGGLGGAPVTTDSTLGNSGGNGQASKFGTFVAGFNSRSRGSPRERERGQFSIRRQ